MVASEIHDLADQSAKCTKDIDYIVTEIISKVESAVSKSEESELILSEQTSTVIKTADKFSQILSSTIESEEAINIISKSGKQIKETNSDVQNIMHKLSEEVGKNAASVEESFSSVEKQSTMIKQVSIASESLSSLAQNLNNLVNTFRI